MLALPFLLRICLPSPWSPPFPLHALALILLSHTKVQLSLLPHDLVLGLTALFLFLLARAAPAFLPTALSVALRPLFPFQQAQYAQSFSAEACAIQHALCWSQQHQQVCHFFFFSYLTLVLTLRLCFLLRLSFYRKLCGRSGRNCLLSSVLSGYNGSTDICFSWGLMQLMSWPDGERYLCTLQFLVVSLLLSLVSTILFSRTGGVLSHQNSLTCRFPRFPLRNLCSLLMRAVFSLAYAATDTAFC